MPCCPCLPGSLFCLQIGNTPMIGRNDVETEVFYQADAHKVRGLTVINRKVGWVPNVPACVPARLDP